MTRLIAFYLPQFHSIPENDRWWGEGFTEWTNVRKAEPRFPGHYQPHEPGELGYYDLRDPAVRLAQADLARAHGIHGFCYYHYWFNGRMLLDQPFNDVLASGEPNFPFCLCWANENWTRAWDGLDREVLMVQDYGHYDPHAHFSWLTRAFADRRYIRVAGKPLFLVYRAEQIPLLPEVLATWRAAAASHGFPGIFLCGVNNMQSPWSRGDWADSGLDALVDFQPNPRDVAAAHAAGKAAWLDRMRRLCERFVKPKMRGVFRYDYSRIVRAAMARQSPELGVLPCVFPSWDNSARRRTNVTVIQNDDASLYGRWLDHAVKRVSALPEEERLVFINAWNEWAEGCHLEPDRRHGRSFLHATLRVIAGGGDEE